MLRSCQKCGYESVIAGQARTWALNGQLSLTLLTGGARRRDERVRG